MNFLARDRRTNPVANCTYPASRCGSWQALALIAVTCFYGELIADPISRQVETLLSQMTLDEKIGQMTQVDMNGLKDKADIQKYFLGSMLSGGDSDPADITAEGWRKVCEEYQRHRTAMRRLDD